MDDIKYEGKLVFLTIHYDQWLREVNPKFNIPMANRIARVIKVFEWDTQEGKTLLRAREKTNKWGNFNPKDFKFVLKVYCPELVMGSRRGISTEEISPLNYPGTELKMFELMPDWMLKEVRSDNWESFTVAAKGTKVSTRTKPESNNKQNKVVKKSAAKKRSTRKNNVS